MTLKFRNLRARAATSILTGLTVLFAAHRAEAAQVSCKGSLAKYYRSSPELVISRSDQPNTLSLLVNSDSGTAMAACGADLGAGRPPVCTRLAIA